MNHTQHRLADIDEGDVDGEFAVTVDEFLGAVERINQPEWGAGDIGRVTVFEGLFADDRVFVGDAAADGADNQFFGGLVGFRDRGLIGLFLDLEIGFVDLHDFLAGPLGDVADLGQKVQ